MFVTKKTYNSVVGQLNFANARLAEYERAAAKQAKKELAKLNEKKAEEETSETTVEDTFYEAPTNNPEQKLTATDRKNKANEMSIAGYNVDEIAIALGITNRTVKKYLA